MLSNHFFGSQSQRDLYSFDKWIPFLIYLSGFYKGGIKLNLSSSTWKLKKKSSVWSCVLICDKETWASEKWWNIRLWFWQIRILVRHIDLFIFLQIGYKLELYHNTCGYQVFYADLMKDDYLCCSEKSNCLCWWS